MVTLWVPPPFFRSLRDERSREGRRCKRIYDISCKDKQGKGEGVHGMLGLSIAQHLKRSKDARRVYDLVLHNNFAGRLLFATQKDVIPPGDK